MRASSTLTLLLLAALGGCARSSPHVRDPRALDPGRLPAPDTLLRIPALRSCTDSPDDTIRISTSHPVTVLVHGCKGSVGRFRSLAQLYAFHGQQAVCFEYDDRKSLVVSSGQLISAIDQLVDHLGGQQVTVIGHSMGGLVARKAMEDERRAEWRQRDAHIRLVTVSAPLSGIQSARTCGKRPLYFVSLGLVPAICWFVTGDNWKEITPSASFIQHPGPLLPWVQRYLKVVTDERNACQRRDAKGDCVEPDYAFSLAEQYQPVIDHYPQVVNVEVASGHNAIVGERDAIPRQLLEILQQQGLLARTPPERRDALERLLVELYGEAPRGPM